MPDINGWEILDQFEKQFSTKVKTKIFILTSTINADHHKRFTPKPYAPEYLIKPLNQKIIDGLFHKYFPENKSFNKNSDHISPKNSLGLF